MAEIRTGVPYNPDMMAEIYENGAIVDLSKVNFPTCKNLEERGKISCPKCGAKLKK